MWRGVEYHTVFTYDGIADPTPKANARLVVTEDVPTTDLALRSVVNTIQAATNNDTTNGKKGSGAQDLVNGSMKGSVVTGLVMALASFFL